MDIILQKCIYVALFKHLFFFYNKEKNGEQPYDTYPHIWISIDKNIFMENKNT